MSYKITVSRPSDDDVLLSLNWHRNPFGLCSFVEDNAGDQIGSLHHICNDHAYDRVKNLDRKKFLRIIKEYGQRLRAVKQAYFFFNFRSYVQFVEKYPTAMLLSLSKGFMWHESRIGIRVERFQSYGRKLGWIDEPVLGWYQQWFKKLAELVAVMQDPDIEVRIEK